MNSIADKLNRQQFRLDRRHIVLLRECDLEDIRHWRNSQSSILRTKTMLSSDDQRRYFENVVKPSQAQSEPTQILFSYLDDTLGDRTCVGYGGLTNIDWSSSRAEVSFLMKTEITEAKDVYKSYFQSYLYLLKHVAFQAVGLHRLFTETYDLRPWHIEVLEASGFRFEGRLQDHVRIDGRFVDSLFHGCIAQVADHQESK